MLQKNTEIWEVKGAVRYRDKNRCVGCGMTNEKHVEKTGRRLEVHRKVPGSEYTVDGCELLCAKCHDGKPRKPNGSRDKAYAANFRGHVTQDLADALRALSRTMGRRGNLANEIRIAIEDHLKKSLAAIEAKPGDPLLCKEHVAAFLAAVRLAFAHSAAEDAERYVRQHRAA